VEISRDGSCLEDSQGSPKLKKLILESKGVNGVATVAVSVRFTSRCTVSVEKVFNHFCTKLVGKIKPFRTV
jgi:hypothetical protein